MAIRYIISAMDNKVEADRESFFKEQMGMAKKEEMINLLKCKLCEGLLRFAHTLAECGHTFCQQCIFTYIHAFKGKRPQIKCPQCHVPVEPPFSRSIIKDIFKQNLVDVLDPSYSTQEKIIVQRIHQLFPNFNLSFLLDQFSFSSLGSKPPPYQATRKKSEKSRLMIGLANVVKQKLGITFEFFAQQIRDDSEFDKLLEKVGASEKVECEPTVIQVRPHSDKDYRFVGINTKIKLPNPEVGKLRKYLQKRLLMRLKDNDELAREIVRSDSTEISIRIALSLQGRILQEGQSLVGLSTDNPVYYSFRM